MGGDSCGSFHCTLRKGDNVTIFGTLRVARPANHRATPQRAWRVSRAPFPCRPRVTSTLNALGVSPSNASILSVAIPALTASITQARFPAKFFHPLRRHFSHAAEDGDQALFTFGYAFCFSCPNGAHGVRGDAVKLGDLIHAGVGIGE